MGLIDSLRATQILSGIFGFAIGLVAGMGLNVLGIGLDDLTLIAFGFLTIATAAGLAAEGIRYQNRHHRMT